jgi:hypothetical protein
MFCKSIGTVPATTLAAMPTLEMILFSKNDVSLWSFVKIFGFQMSSRKKWFHAAKVVISS